MAPSCPAWLSSMCATSSSSNSKSSRSSSRIDRLRTTLGLHQQGRHAGGQDGLVAGGGWAARRARAGCWRVQAPCSPACTALSRQEGFQGLPEQAGSAGY